MRFADSKLYLLAALVPIAWLGFTLAQPPQPKPVAVVEVADDDGELFPSQLPLKFSPKERIAFVGGSLAERFNLYGHFETLLHTRFPELNLVVRNFARPADEVANRQRPSNYTKIDDPLYAFDPDTFLCFFGFNESFAGPTGVAKFEADYASFLEEFRNKYPREGKNTSPRFVLISPTAFEKTGDPLLPKAEDRNADLTLYADAVRRVAQKNKLAFVDLYSPTEKLFSEGAGFNFTVNGVHANEAGDKVIGTLLDAALFAGPNPGITDTAKFEKLRTAVNDKSWVHQQDYRMLNGWYVYGGRRTWDTETFPKEYSKIRNMTVVRDQYVWDIVAGKEVAAKPDDSKTGELIVPPTRFGVPRQKYSENPEGGPNILPPADLIKTCTVPEGFEIKLFADESKFPEIAKPVQISFDGKGRLWLSTMPSYPQWQPGDPKPSDKLVILEDTDNDGQADKSTVFYDKLHCPTGFEFYNGGVLVVDQPRILFLKDTNGDDKADVVIPVLDGWASDDTHHTVGAWEFSHSGLLRMQEGVSMSTTVETPWGPFRNFGSSGSYVLDPRTWKISHFNTPGYGNPWCYLFNEWNQGIVGDGTGANQHWDTPLSGQQFVGRKGLRPVFPTEGMRPVVGSEFLVSRQFPDDVQGQFIYACVINTNGMPRWTITDDGAGYQGVRVRHNPKDPKTAFDLIKSTDKHFRPVDPKIGPDGALWFGDWANPLIGHMQYSQRDPNRDHVHGRVYRLVYKEKPLLKPITQDDKSVAELLEQLRVYEWRMRYTIRRVLQGRPQAEVLPAVTEWVKGLKADDPEFDRLRCEALWTQQSFHAVDVALAKEVLQAKTADARAAAVRVIADERDYLPDAQMLLVQASADSHPRVITEAVRGLSFFTTVEATKAVLQALAKAGDDYFVEYTANAALSANLDVWRTAYLSGEIGQEAGLKKTLDGILATDKKGAQLLPYLQILLGKEEQAAEAKNKAMQALADLKGGNANNGQFVFQRNCTACHKIKETGQDYGPALDDVATRLNRYKLVESIFEPNAEIDEKYLTTQVVTLDGKSVMGLLVKETKEEIEIFDGKDKQVIKIADIDDRKVLKQSSMPEGLAGTISPVEFLDLIQYLSTMKEPKKKK